MSNADQILAALGMSPPKKPLLGRLHDAPKPKGNAAHWRAKLAGQGNLRAYKPTAGERVEAGLGSVLGKVVGDKAAKRLAGRAMAPLNDLTPVGDALAAAAGVTDIRKGNYVSGAGNLLLSAIGAVPVIGDGAAIVGKKAAAGLKGMTREEFLGAPTITSPRNGASLEPRAYSFLDDVQPEPFMDRFAVKHHPDGTAVFDGDKLIASYNSGDTLVVDKKYRKQGIATELVHQWRSRYPAPSATKYRTKAAQKVQEKVWDRIAREQGN